MDTNTVKTMIMWRLENFFWIRRESSFLKTLKLLHHTYIFLVDLWKQVPCNRKIQWEIKVV